MEHKNQTVDLLMEKLVRVGFPAEQLRSQIEDAVNMDLPVFSVNCNAPYGEEKMSYELRFVQTPNPELPYIFTELHATHRNPVDIEHHQVNGIDTLALDRLMDQVNWEHVFSAKTVEDPKTVALIGELRRLADGDPAYGKYTQQCLMYKHWPAPVYLKYRDPEMPDLREAHEHSYTFRAASGDTLNAHLAYHIISERYDSLLDMAEGIGLHEIENSFPVDFMLKQALCNNSAAFTLNGHLNLPEGYAEFSVPVTKINDWYSIQEYELSFTPYPSMNHGVFSGINTAELEAEMRKVDWRNDKALFHFPDDSAPEFKGAVYEIQDQLYRIGQDPVGAEIADLLQLKYLMDVTFFGENINQCAWDHLAELPKLTRKFPADQDITSAIYLLFGRPVFASVGPEHTENIRHWCILDLTDAGNGYPMRLFESYSRQELSDLLRPLVYHHALSDVLADDLMKGQRINVSTPADKKIIIEACPEQKNLLFYSEDMRPIPVNLHMDPDWKPVQTDAAPKKKVKTYNNINAPARKGKRRKM